MNNINDNEEDTVEIGHWRPSGTARSVRPNIVQQQLITVGKYTALVAPRDDGKWGYVVDGVQKVADTLQAVLDALVNYERTL